MRIDCVVVGPIGTNCYILTNDKHEALIVDPGDHMKSIVEKLEEREATPLAILITHGHFDHTGAVLKLIEKYKIPTYANILEEPVFTDKNYSMALRPIEIDNYLKDGDIVTISDFTFKMISTPGHTLGGACFYFEKEKALFSGDSLFFESVGRTDFRGGSGTELTRNLKEKIMLLPDDTDVYPGHMEFTTIGHERVNNPFIC
ncbi:MAG: MBL fold metallo-hydrolase [Lachnospiraceae bacterium]|nr:MBL fold metallo-hydrolase [Lachnospiraceae bacterium]MBQ9580518.1 MBL fold metallo-hydrolase [Lachnospiraceae bacterium]